MSGLQSTPYGSWKSPITADLIVGQTVRLGQIVVDGEDIYWIEMRPAEGGRNVIVKRTPDGKLTDMTSAGFNARTRVHEYGGGAFTVNKGTLYFSNDNDQRVYKQTTQTAPEPLTPKKEFRYADAIVDEHRNRLICVREDHTSPGQEAVNSLVSINLVDGDDCNEIAAGNDFYSSPSLSPDGKKLTWLTWNHPNMPWDGTELWLAEITEDGNLSNQQKVAGGIDESIFQPQWSPDGILYFVSDKSGWWNLYSWRDGSIDSILEKEAEFGLPQWIFGMSTYAFDDSNRLVCTYFDKGTWKLARLNTNTRQFDNIDLPFTHFECVKVSNGQAVFLAASSILGNAVVNLNLKTDEFEILRKSADVALDSTYLSRPETIEFPTEQGRTAHAYFYPPQNRDYDPPEDELPPLIVKSHGGPTAATSTGLELRIQFWTSRGFAVLDVNYGGSTGYGREYRQRLNDHWGIVDVDDCVNAAKYLVDKKRVDPNRTAIAGGSAGGYTTLSALTFRDFFKGGASYYGVSDLEALTKDTHKFESRYLDKLIGAYPEMKAVYLERSPIHHTGELSCPIILFQGLEDKVVPPNQAEMMVKAVRSKGLPVAYVAFEGEQHGFRKAENVKRTLEAELYFYSKIFGFELTETIEPVQIYNLQLE